MTAWMQNLRYALRQLRRSPGFAVTAVLTLALGVGANTAIFSLLDQALLRSLPVRDPKQLVILQGTGKVWNGRSSGHGGSRELLFSYPMYRDLRDKGPFAGLIATSSAPVSIKENGSASIQDAELVTGNYFNVLGVKPALGRLLTQGDDTAPGAGTVAVLSYEYWAGHLGSDPGIAGRVLSVNGQPFTILGVAAPNFRSAVWGQTPALFVPMSSVAQVDASQAKGGLTDHKDRWLNLVGRLRDGETQRQAETASQPLWHALRAEELKAMGGRSPAFTRDFLTDSRLHLLNGAQGLSYSRDRLQRPLLIVMGMAVLVLLIASTNVASLLLVRSAARTREISVRYALGATGRRIVEQLLLEGVLIGLTGGLLGAVAAPPVVRVLNARLTSVGDPDFFHTGLDTRLLLFSLAVSLAVSVVFSLVPALQALKPDLVASLKQQGGTAGASRLGFRRAVVCLQVGLSVLLLTCSGLLVRSLQNLRHVDVGFNTQHLLTFRIQPDLAGYTPDRIDALRRQTQQALAAIPGVESVSGTDSAELANSDCGTNVSVEGYTAPPDEDLDIGCIAVEPGYFQTLKAPLVAGRAFTETDDLHHPLVAVVNQSFARHYFGSDAAAIGKRMARGAGNGIAWREIVGVSRDARHISLREPVKMTDFTPMLQDTKVSDITFYLRTSRDASSTFQDVRTVMRRIDPGLALERMRTMDEQIDQILQNERLISLLAVSFGVLATLLAGIGLYGVLAYSTAQRTREIGIRMALGSSRGRVSGMVLADVLRLAGVGVLVAVPCAMLLAHALRSQLYGVSSADPLTVACVVALIGIVALVAALLPARRAANVDPNVALRTE